MFSRGDGRRDGFRDVGSPPLDPASRIPRLWPKTAFGVSSPRAGAMYRENMSEMNRTASSSLSRDELVLAYAAIGVLAATIVFTVAAIFVG